MDDIPNVTVLECSQISPPPATVGHRSLPLTFFDMSWLLYPPVQHIFFYHFPHSKSHFNETIVPSLKHSLSITLQHFFPFVSNLVVYPNPNHNPNDDSVIIKRPEIRHVEGDYVALTVAETTLDFNDLVGNHPRKCENFCTLVPQLGDTVKKSDHVTLPLFSLQVTYFRDVGISVGMTNHHCLGDASTRYGFMKAWASVSESGGDQSFGSPPVYDRLVDIPELTEKKLKQTRLEGFYQHSSLVATPDKVRATFVLTRTHINHLKKQVQTQVPSLEYVSSYTVTCGYLWSCIAKSYVKMGEKKDENELEQLIIPVNIRSRLDPPVPSTYFGNCGAPCIVAIKHIVLSGESGFVIASKMIAEGISKLVNNKEGILKDAEKWHDGFKVPARKIGISGTTKQNFYDVDFGWGKPIKYETVSFDGSICIGVCKESAQDFEIGVNFSSMQMEVFAKIFNDGLKSANGL